MRINLTLREKILFALFLAILWSMHVTPKIMKYSSSPITIDIFVYDEAKNNASKKFIDDMDVSFFQPILDFYEREAPGKSRFIFRNIQRIPNAPPQNQGTWGKTALEVAPWATYYRGIWNRPSVVLFLTIKEHTADGYAIANHSFAHVNLGYKNPEFGNLIVAHELLHLIGASDKYDSETGSPIYPQGYLEPNKEPLYPQSGATLMAGKVSTTKDHFLWIFSLNDNIHLTDLTLKEILWD